MEVTVVAPPLKTTEDTPEKTFPAHVEAVFQNDENSPVQAESQAEEVACRAAVIWTGAWVTTLVAAVAPAVRMAIVAFCTFLSVWLLGLSSPLSSISTPGPSAGVGT